MQLAFGTLQCVLACAYGVTDLVSSTGANKYPEAVLEGLCIVSKA